MIARIVCRFWVALAWLWLTGLPAFAECSGMNLADALPSDQAAALDAAVAAQPFPQGNFWRAEKDGRRLWVIGTYHYDDPRHAPAMAAVRALLPQVNRLLVEAGPEEKRALMRAMAERPELLYYTEGASLMQRLSAEEWDALTTAMKSRNLPPVMVAKLRPWYVSTLLATPACQMEGMSADNGLDAQIIDAAETAGLPITALEPYDTIFKLFDQMPEADQLDMIRTTLHLEAQAADHAVTLGDLYFRGEARRLWEFTRMMTATLPGYDTARADAEFARMEDLLMTRRNRDWIPVLEGAAAEGDTLAAFGALHLPGQTGVLNLLAARGWQIARLDWADTR